MVVKSSASASQPTSEISGSGVGRRLHKGWSQEGMCCGQEIANCWK